MSKIAHAAIIGLAAKFREDWDCSQGPEGKTLLHSTVIITLFLFSLCVFLQS